MTARTIFGQNVAAPQEKDEFANIVLPEGRYSFMIVEAKVDPTMAWASIKLQVLEGDQVGDKIIHFFGLGGERTQEQIAKSLAEMSSLCEVLGLAGNITSMDPFINKCITADVKYQKESQGKNGKTYAAKNWVSFALDTLTAYTPAAPVVASLAPTQTAIGQVPTPAQQNFTPQEIAEQAAINQLAAAQQALDLAKTKNVEVPGVTPPTTPVAQPSTDQPPWAVK